MAPGASGTPAVVPSWTVTGPIVGRPVAVPLTGGEVIAGSPPDPGLPPEPAAGARLAPGMPWPAVDAWPLPGAAALAARAAAPVTTLKRWALAGAFSAGLTELAAVSV